MDVSLPQKYLVKNNCNIPVGHFYLSCHFVQKQTFDEFETGLAESFTSSTISTDNITEETSGAGVTVDGVLIKDGSVEVTKGNVTQLTSITTGVTSTASSGTITTVSSTIAAGASASFIVTTPFAKTTSKIFLNANSAGDGIPYAVVSAKTNGTFTVKLFNVDGTDALNAVVTVDFLIV